MRTRLIIAFVVVALLAAIASSWFHTLIESYHLPGWLDGVILGPGWLRRLVLTYAGRPPLQPARLRVDNLLAWVTDREEFDRPAQPRELHHLAQNERFGGQWEARDDVGERRVHGWGVLDRASRL